MLKALTRRQILRVSSRLAAGQAMLAALNAVGILTGCSSQVTPTAAPQVEATATIAPVAEKEEPTATTAATAQETECQMDWTPQYPPVPKKYSPVVQVTAPWNASAQFHVEGDDFGNNPYTRRLKEEMGLEYVVWWTLPSASESERLLADIAAGSLPDVFHISGDTLASLIRNDAVEEIREIFEATASPLAKEVKGYPGKQFLPVQRGDKLYGVGFSWGSAYEVDCLGYIRKDWLDKLGLQMPTTLDELTDVLSAFVESGTSQFGITGHQNLVSWKDSLDSIFGAFGVMPTTWQETPEGALEYSGIQPGAKEALKVLRNWYEKGLLDPDYYTYTTADSSAHAAAGKTGVYFSPWWSATGHNQMEEEVPGCEWALMPFPKGPDGKMGRKGTDLVGPAVVFRKGLEVEKIEAVLNHMNWAIEQHVNWEKYQLYGEAKNSTIFEQGYDWEFDENCELQAGPAGESCYLYVYHVGFFFPCNCYPKYQKDVFGPILEWAKQDPSTLNKAQRYLIQNPAIVRGGEYYLYADETENICMYQEFLGSPSAEMSKIWPELQTMENEVYNSIVVGGRPLDDFDKFVEDWKANGGEAVTREVNEWKESVG